MIELTLLPGMSSQAWEGVWRESCEILRQFPVPLYGRKTINSPFGTRVVYTDDFIEDDQWLVIGDSASDRMGDAFTLFRDLEDWRGDAPSSSKTIFQTFRDRLGIPSVTGPALISGQTHGFPYHEAILAVGMLIESRFPEHCHLCGHFSRNQVQRLLPWLNSFLSKPVFKPRCFDAARLWNALEGAGLEDAELARYFHWTFDNHAGEEERWLYAQSPKWATKVIAERFLEVASLWRHQLNLRNVLEGTEDMGKLFDVVDAAIAFRKESKPKPLYDFFNRPVKVDPEDGTPKQLLQVLIMAGITVPEWQEGALEKCGDYLRQDHNADGHFSALMAQLAGAQPTWDYKINSEELLEAFIARYPEQEQVMRDTHEETEAKLVAKREKFEELVGQLSAKADEKPMAVTDAPKPRGGLAAGMFEEFMLANAEAQRKIAADPVQVAKAKGVAIQKFIKAAKRSGKDWNFDCPEQYLGLLTAMNEGGGLWNLTEKAWQRIDAETDLKTLKNLSVLIFNTPEKDEDHFFTKLFLQNPEYWPLLCGKG